MSWPTPLEVAAFLVDAALIEETPSDETTLDVLIAQVVARWEKVTNWKPYLVGDAANLTFRFNRDQKLYALASSCTEPSSVTGSISGALEYGAHWRWLNPNRPAEVEFLTTLSDGETITFAGVTLGKVTAIPDDVKSAFFAGCMVQYCENHPSAEANLQMMRIGEVSATKDRSAVDDARKRWGLAVWAHARKQVVY